MMDWLEMRQEAAMQDTDREVEKAIREWTHPIGTRVRGALYDVENNGLRTDIEVEGCTTSMGVRRWPIATVQIDGDREVWLNGIEVLLGVKGSRTPRNRVR